MTTEPGRFLVQPVLEASHQIPIAGIPEISAMGKIADDTHAVGLDDVLAERLGMERRQLTMPKDGLGAGIGIVRLRFDGRLTVGGCEFKVFRHDVCSAGSVCTKHSGKPDPSPGPAGSLTSAIARNIRHHAWNIPPAAKVRRYLGG